MKKNPLNDKDINGNTRNLELDDRGYDEYYCTKCKRRVYEDEYNDKKRICYRCWYGETCCK